MPARSNDHFASLTGLRGIAAWWVVLFHFNEYLPATVQPWIRLVSDNGYLAVDLFFILSGFILGYNYLLGFQTLDRRKYMRFLGVRLARIYPLHITMLTVFLINPVAISVAASAAIDGARYNPWYFLLSIVLLQNWGFTDNLAWNVPAWSISTEWFAYLCFPLIGWMVSRIPRCYGIATAMLGVLLPLMVLAAGISAEHGSLGGDITGNGVFRCVAEFTSGIFLYRLWSSLGRFGLAGGVSAVLALGCVALYCLSDLTDCWLIPLAWAALIFALAVGVKAFSLLLANRAIQLAGAWSYSTYLVHYFIRDWIKFLLIHDGDPTVFPLICYLGATAVASALLFRLVEVPGRLVFRRQLDRLMPASD